VTVNDLEHRSSFVPNIVAGADLGQCARSNVTYAAAVIDNCSGANSRLCAAEWFDLPEGRDDGQLYGDRFFGNTNGCSFTVRVNDLEPPVITCPTTS